MIDCLNCGSVFLFDDFMHNSIGIKCKCGNINLHVHEDTLFEILDKRFNRKFAIRAQKTELLKEIKELGDRLFELCKYAV